jgi:uncharacterized protein (TIGR00255 family)
MTGHGHACLKDGTCSIDVEVRTVNNRFLKIASKVSEVAAAIEVDLENLVREFVRRGTVSISIRVAQNDRTRASRVCTDTLRSYIEQSQGTMAASGEPWTMELGSMLQLPGVLETPTFEDTDELLSQVTATLRSALSDLNQMRIREGKAMAVQLQQGLSEIRKLRARIDERAPQVLEEYRRRLEGKLRIGLAETGNSSNEIDVIREVLLFSDRCDIREELVRLESHLDQFEHSMVASESQGRRLDFLIQELLRETNTIGSKANDAKIAHDVVSIKTLIEQLREMVQNIE